MSHFFTAVIIPPTGDPEKHVNKLLAAHEEDENGGHWDWFQIGGRWTGVLADYDPATDPRNTEICSQCGGTGIRTDRPEMVSKVIEGVDSFGEERVNHPRLGQTGWCNGCDGRGTRSVWPTNFQRYPGDVMQISKLPKQPTPHALVTPDGRWQEIGEMGWFGAMNQTESEGDWAEVIRATLEKYQDHRIVVVDCHI
ncbi:hypothetical protein KGP36_01775 [Patescibacteria group bacterium]|nr:hypothetical protein [Patescibacteria group bacterium]